jgi:hypothetical protein
LLSKDKLQDTSKDLSSTDISLILIAYKAMLEIYNFGTIFVNEDEISIGQSELLQVTH